MKNQIKKFWSIAVITVIFPWNVHLAQNVDCSSDEVRLGLRKGETFVVPCDSMVLLTQFTYAKIALEESMLKDRIDKIEIIKGDQEKLIRVLEKDSRDLEQHIKKIEPKFEEMGQKLEESMNNTEEAVKIARQNKIIWGGAGAGIGIVLGFLFAN